MHDYPIEFSIVKLILKDQSGSWHFMDFRPNTRRKIKNISFNID
jgi:hypothetical protein